MSNQGGYGNNIDGIPLPGDMPQIQGSSTPNRDDTSLLSNPDGDTEGEYAVDYFDAVENETGQQPEPYVADKSNQKWSEGLEDEENDYGLLSFDEQDNDWNEGLLPETQPLHLESRAERDVETPPDSELQSDIELQPGTVENGTDL
jgi:hypothetical protein